MAIPQLCTLPQAFLDQSIKQVCSSSLTYVESFSSQIFADCGNLTKCYACSCESILKHPLLKYPHLNLLDSEWHFQLRQQITEKMNTFRNRLLSWSNFHSIIVVDTGLGCGRLPSCFLCTHGCFPLNGHCCSENKDCIYYYCDFMFFKSL